jgi:hypothetical protein
MNKIVPQKHASTMPTHRQPEPPTGFEVFEERVMAADWPLVVVVDRAFIRALLRSVRRLERDVAEGSFW